MSKQNSDNQHDVSPAQTQKQIGGINMIINMLIHYITYCCTELDSELVQVQPITQTNLGKQTMTSEKEQGDESNIQKEEKQLDKEEGIYNYKYFGVYQ